MAASELRTPFARSTPSRGATFLRVVRCRAPLKHFSAITKARRGERPSRRRVALPEARPSAATPGGPHENLFLGAALALLSSPALAQYGGGGHNSGGPLGSYERSGGYYGGYGYAPYPGGYGYYGPPPVYSWGAPVQYGYPGYYGGGPVAAGIVGGLALGALAARPYYYPRRIYRPYARVYRRW